MLKPVVAIAAVILVTLAVFAPVRQYDFVAYDDPAFVVDHPVIQRGLTMEGVRWAFEPLNAYSAAGGPVTWLSHMLDISVFGMKAGPQHLVNLGFHTLNSALLLLVLWRMTGAIGRSACVAALFAIHPLHVESVAWISERKDVLSAMFWLLTMLAYVSYVRRPGLLRYAMVFILLALGLMSKPAVATLPFALLLLDAWPLERGPLRWAGRKKWWPLLLEKLPLIALSAIAMIVTLASQRSIGAVSSVSALPAALRVQNAVVAYATYLRKLIWPVDLTVFYPYPSSTAVGELALCFGVVVALSALAWRAARTRPFVTVGWLWYLGTLIPMAGLVQVGSHSMADRFTYVPLIGIFILVVWTAAEMAARFKLARPAMALACVVVAVAAVSAKSQVSTWRNSETLWTHAMAVTNGNSRAYAGLAEVAAARGDVSQAIADYREALRLAPDDPDWHVNLGLLLVKRGDQQDIAQAVDAFSRALVLRPNDPESENNLGAMLARLGRPREAIEHYQRALKLRPSYALAQQNLELAYAQLKR